MPRPDVPASPIVLRDGESVVPETVLQVRKAIYSHDQLTASDMDLVFNVARKAGCSPCPEWTALFSEALTDYVVHQNDPPDYIPQEKADWLAANLTKTGGICSRAEFDMLLDVMTNALGVPTSLSTFALNEIKTAILEGRRGAITGEDHPAGVVTEADVEALRAVLYAAKTGTPDHVTRDEAEVLFQIAHATKQAAPSFDDLFARAIGNYLMAISEHVPDAAEALHFEKWLDERESVGNFMSQMVGSLPDFEHFTDALKPSAMADEADYAQENAVDRTLRRESEKVTDSEAAWVMAHLTRDGELTSAEKRLLLFLGAESPSIAPPLRALIDKTNMAAAHVPQTDNQPSPPTFGKRKGLNATGD